MKYIKGSFIGRPFPIVKGEKFYKEGHVIFSIDTLQKDENIVRFTIQTFDKARNETGNAKMLLTQDTAKEIGDALFTLFDSRYYLKKINMTDIT